MFLPDVKTDEMYKIFINICLEICKQHVLPKKSQRKHQIPRGRRALMRKRSKLQKKIQMSTNHQTKVYIYTMTFSLHQGEAVMSSQVKHTHSDQDTPLSPYT